MPRLVLLAASLPFLCAASPHMSVGLDQVPPGTYQLVVWHPQTGPGLSKTITVKADDKLSESLSLPAPKGHRSAFKVIDNPRFGPESRGRSIDINPFVEHQH